MIDVDCSRTFDGQHVVVTGGASGIGAAIATHFVNAGAAVTVMGRNETRLAAFSADVGAHWQVVDVADEQSVRVAFSNAEKTSGGVSVLVNNAGIAEARPFKSTDSDFWRRTMSVNLDGVFFCSSAVIPAMLKAGNGRIVNIASTAALKGYAYVGAYCASKHAVVGLTRSMAQEYARAGITVNAVCPGYTDTDIVTRSVEKIAASTGRSQEEALAELLKSNPQGRLIAPREVASTVLWLASADCGSVTGQSIVVAGGEVM